ncbi:hypothetical protein BCR34DRAFT_549413 [Clohesyomyces aquaticus]|uniref:J domain-containing protein n=1 Tax=Clohesyomyces aquaticus TaxID=1231657 RepID=A0A1Y1YDY5_9PLEO|nr:hypothetical protein BCR34DRAFT_549413 [Clohesyomyces aquaticus]
MSTQTQTYYRTLALSPDAPTEVIRAAYKALALRYHPDKTIHHSAEERAKSAAIFRQVQEAWDVLGNVDLKAHYDLQLEEEEEEEEEEPDFQPSSSVSSTTKSRTYTNSSLLTTPADKATIRAKLRQQMTKLAEDRTKRDQEDSAMPLDRLKYTLKIWKEMYDENQDSALDRAYCQIKIFEYEKKVQIREQEKEDWLRDISSAKGRSKQPAPAFDARKRAPPSSPTTPTKPQHQSHPSTPTRTHTPSAFALRRGKQENERAAQDASRAALRAEENARVDAAKEALLNSKVASVRSEKEKLRLKVEEAAMKEAERIARVRAKVAPKPKADATEKKEGAGRVDTPTSGREGQGQRRRECRLCRGAHASVAEWKKCSMRATAEEVEEDAFLNDV